MIHPTSERVCFISGKTGGEGEGEGRGGEVAVGRLADNTRRELRPAFNT